MTIRAVDLSTGEETSREYTPGELDVIKSQWPTSRQIIEFKKQAVRELRERVLDRLAGIAGRAQRKGDTALASACDAASEALLDITQDLPAVPEEVEALLVSRYQLIAATAIAAAPSLATAFAEIDA